MGKVDFSKLGKQPLPEVPKKEPVKQKVERKPVKKEEPREGIDLRDEIDLFVNWIKQAKPEEFTGKREAIIKRIQSYQRPSLIEGTIELLAIYLKEKGYKVIH